MRNYHAHNILTIAQTIKKAREDDGYVWIFYHFCSFHDILSVGTEILSTTNKSNVKALSKQRSALFYKMRLSQSSISTAIVMVTGCHYYCLAAFIPSHQYQSSRTTPLLQQRQPSFLAAGAKYGPPDDIPPIESSGDLDDDEVDKIDAARMEHQRKQFQSLIDEVMSASSPEVLPGTMTKHMDSILAMHGFEGQPVIELILEDAAKSGGEDYAEEVARAIDFILTFVEEFVDQTKSANDEHKQNLGKIIRFMSDRSSTDRDQEVLLDDLLECEKENFTPGFLRHVEGECDRISSAPEITPESTKLIETLRVIQARVVEELGKDLGEGALVLGQLLGYDNKSERLAVLDAGLTVRGIGFAKEMAALTEEALEGFAKVPNVDPELVDRVSGIDNRIQKFIARNDKIQ